MSKYIATRLHKAIELAPEEPFFRRCAELPHYVIDQSLLELLARSDVQASVAAMIEANIARLPFPEMLIELDTGVIRQFVVLKETEARFTAEVGALHSKGAAEVSPGAYELELSDAKIRVLTKVRSHEAWMQVAALSLGISLLMLNIQGVEKEVIDPRKLNRQRLAGGKPAIPTHSVIRIGHVYDSDGWKIPGGTGRHMPVHMRAGHARRQHYGENNSMVKVVYIPPVLVNFAPGDKVKQPKRILAA